MFTRCFGVVARWFSIFCQEIFALLDRVICLCHQRAIYHGPATELSRWLDRLEPFWCHFGELTSLNCRCTDHQRSSYHTFCWMIFLYRFFDQDQEPDIAIKVTDGSQSYPALFGWWSLITSGLVDRSLRTTILRITCPGSSAVLGQPVLEIRHSACQRCRNDRSIYRNRVFWKFHQVSTLPDCIILYPRSPSARWCFWWKPCRGESSNPLWTRVESAWGLPTGSVHLRVWHILLSPETTVCLIKSYNIL